MKIVKSRDNYLKNAAARARHMAQRVADKKITAASGAKPESMQADASATAPDAAAEEIKKGREDPYMRLLRRLDEGRKK